ncbi:protein FAM151B isoform X3 [Heptranchias perlo]|uniref:protein FAM151B isoform X3 n=1 Tax=Heptranchias perlo TaxID=212740 RepID=UPI00355A662F
MMKSHNRGGGGENAVEYFLNQRRIHSKDAVEIIWSHAANRKAQMKEALNSDAHMIEADVLFGSQGSHEGQPIMAHPPETDSDNTLHNWLNEVLQSDKGIKLDFKSLSAVEPSMKMLVSMKDHLTRPVWINADILPGPNGSGTATIPNEFLHTVTSYLPDVTLSLGWTTNWLVNQTNNGKDYRSQTHSSPHTTRIMLRDSAAVPLAHSATISYTNSTADATTSKLR